MQYTCITTRLGRLTDTSIHIHTHVAHIRRNITCRCSTGCIHLSRMLHAGKMKKVTISSSRPMPCILLTWIAETPAAPFEGALDGVPALE